MNKNKENKCYHTFIVRLLQKWSYLRSFSIVGGGFGWEYIEQGQKIGHKSKRWHSEEEGRIWIHISLCMHTLEAVFQIASIANSFEADVLSNCFKYILKWLLKITTSIGLASKAIFLRTITSITPLKGFF